jgi:polyhydroxyalkanoate synthase
LSNVDGFAKRQREAFEAWQVKSDEIYQTWMSQPAFLLAGRAAMVASLELYASCRADWGIPGRLDLISSNAREFVCAANSVWRQTAKSFISPALVPGVATTPHDVIYRENKLRLLHYPGTTSPVHPIPVLIVGSLVNRYYILDLLPRRSYVEYLVSQGFDVYLVDWGEPDDADARLSLEDYANGYVPNLVREVLQHSHATELSLLGYSMGGVLALIYSALDQKRVKNLMLLATPVDFSRAGLLSTWTNERFFDVERLVEIAGNIPAQMVQWSFRALKPASNATRAINLLQHADNREEFMVLLALEQWLSDIVPIPGRFYRDFVKSLYQENRLVLNTLSIGGKVIRLSEITCAVLNVIGAHDQTVPPDSSRPLLPLISSKDKRELVLPYGHVTLAVHADAPKDLWAKSSAWLKRRSGTFKKSRRRRNL